MQAIAGSIVILSGAILCAAAAMSPTKMVAPPITLGLILIVFGLVAFIRATGRHPDGRTDE